MAWNCRGAKSSQFTYNMKELIRRYRPKIIVLLEPRISGNEADDSCRRLGRRDWIRSKARGFSGGIWILWDRQEIALTVIHVELHFVHLLVHEANGKIWELTAIYASPQRSLRPALWKQLESIQRSYPWVLIGDFNCTSKEAERSSPGGISDSFVEMLQREGLIDVGYTGPSFTWNYGRDASTRRSARLDRAICDEDWRRQFPEATLRHLPHSYSHHCPILLQTMGVSSAGLGQRPFKFQAAWLAHNEFVKIVQESWSPESTIQENLQQLSLSLQHWNKYTFGNIFQRKRRLTRRLEGIQTCLARHPTAALLKLEEKLRLELNETLRQEEILWMQKSRVQWLRLGD